MAYLTLDTRKLKRNYQHLDQLFRKHDLQWSVVTKLLCGNEHYLEEVLSYGIRQVCDSRLANLRTIKKLAPDVETVFIKPPVPKNASRVVEYADVSLNSSLASLEALSKAAVRAGKIHKAILMIETGERREGIMPQRLTRFFGQVYQLPRLQIIGLGTNLTCMYGVLPDGEKLQTLELCRDMIEAEYKTRLPLLSGGASVTVPLINTDAMPASINHFRVGETLFFGTDVYRHARLPDMEHDLFRLTASIIELHKKPNAPDGDLGYNVSGVKNEFEGEAFEGESYRAIVDIGLLDIAPAHLTPDDSRIKIAGASSDMLVLDLGDNHKKYGVGDELSFTLDYMGVLQAMHSRYIEKRKLNHSVHVPGLPVVNKFWKQAV